jgi:hypothetical protein
MVYVPPVAVPNDTDGCVARSSDWDPVVSTTLTVCPVAGANITSAAVSMKLKHSLYFI